MRTLLASLAGIALVAAALSAAPVTEARRVDDRATTDVSVTDGCLSSVPDPGETKRVRICFTIFKPAGADRAHRVPMIMYSHGWGGSRSTTARPFRRFLDAGYGVISFDQRGFGESGGHAYVERPSVEGHDVRRLVALVSRLRWVQQDGPGDPRLGAIGGSYGGSFQFLGAFEELRTRGTPIFDALAPQITWNDLTESLAPEGVVRTPWAHVLVAESRPTDALPARANNALAAAAATGDYPDGSTEGTADLRRFFRKNGPQWHTRHGRRLDIPVLLGQGTTDSFFPLEQGFQNFRTALTASARRRSIFVAYNGGHVLTATPPGVDASSDPCSQRLAGGDFSRLTIEFFNARLRHERTRLTGWGRYHLATPSNECLTVSSVEPDTSLYLGRVATSQDAGAPTYVKIADGPIVLAGKPYLTGTVTTLRGDDRAFLGLAVGTSPADAHLVQNNVLPIKEHLPVSELRRRIDLPSIAVVVTDGQSLYVAASPYSDEFGGTESRNPGAVLIQDTVVHLPVVGG